MSTRITYPSTTVINSVTTSDSTTVSEDDDAPFTMLEWSERVGTLDNVDTYSDQYNMYLQKWFDVKNVKSTDQKNQIKSVYIRFLKEIVMNYTSDEEKRYLQNVDFTNPVEADPAIPFFAKRIREIIQIIYRNRHPLAFEKIKNSYRGTEYGIKKAIFDNVIRFVNRETLSSLQHELPDIKHVTDNIKINIDYLYDTTSYADTQFLYTTGGELITTGGDVYIGYYNINKHQDGQIVYSTGKIHTTESELLNLINYRVALNSNIDYVRYGNTRQIDLNTDTIQY